MLLVLLFILAYLLGSISSAILACRICQLPDPRTVGSQSAGATNALRIGGKKLALAVLGGDVLKGVIAVLLAKLAGVSLEAQAWVALAVVLGHVYPIFFQFKGGKGVATALGALLVLSPYVALTLLLIWLIIAAIFRYSSLAAIISTLFAPALCSLFISMSTLLPISLLSLLLLWRHRSNVYRLLKRQEPKFGKGASS